MMLGEPFLIQPTILNRLFILCVCALTLFSVQDVYAHKKDFYVVHGGLADEAFINGNIEACKKEIALMTTQAGNDNDLAGWGHIASHIASYAYLSNMTEAGVELEQKAMSLWKKQKGYEPEYIISALSIGHYAFVNNNTQLLAKLQNTIRNFMNSSYYETRVPSNLLLRINNFQTFYAISQQDSLTAKRYLEKGKLLTQQAQKPPIKDQLSYWAACAGYAHRLKKDYDTAIYYLVKCDSLVRLADGLREQGYIEQLNHKKLAILYLAQKDYDKSVYHNQQAALLQKTGKFDSKAHHFNAVRVQFQLSLNQYLSTRRALIIQRILLAGIVLAIILILFMIRHTQQANRRLIKVYNLLFQKEAEAKASLQAKSVFIANMSHEVRTPLNSIVGFSDMLAQEDIDPDLRQEGIELINHNAGLLMKLINDMIDMSSFTQNEINLQVASCEVVALSRNVLQSIRKINQTNIDIRWKSDIDSLIVETDEGRLQQVLINLLTNAIKFTEKGHIELELVMLNQNEAQFSVTDTGIGIPLEKQKSVFKRFEKVDEFSQGTGLGLSICHLIINKVGGRIFIDSEYTKGCRFVFTHPLRYTYNDNK